VKSRVRRRSLARLSLIARPGTFSVVRLGPRARVPRWARAGPVLSITRTPSELSIVCLSDRAPRRLRREDGFRCLEVAGPIAFDAVGVLHAIAAPLARAAIPILAISTFDTDLIFVRRERFEDAVAALTRAGHRIRAAPRRRSLSE
jgi:hypothetical protein